MPAWREVAEDRCCHRGRGPDPRVIARDLRGDDRADTIAPMDSVSQLALGAAVSVAVMGRRTSRVKAAAWGAVAGTLPDLDVLISHGDPVLDMVLHRAETHALLWQTLASVPLAWTIAALQRERALFARWWLAVWLALTTHALLDAMTVYGTQLALPFSDHPFGLGSVFIIDPLFTLPLLAGTAWTLRSGRPRGNGLGLLLATAYLAWGAAAQAHVRGLAEQALAAQGIHAERLLVTPAPFTSVVWRLLAVDRGHYYEGFHSLADRQPQIRFDRFDRGAALEPAVGPLDPVRRIARFSGGFYRLDQAGDTVRVTDLRMGQEPSYIFTFEVARAGPPLQALPVAVQVGARIDLGRGLAWLWARLRGLPAEPPR
jgi:inner membrane protein